MDAQEHGSIQHRERNSRTKKFQRVAICKSFRCAKRIAIQGQRTATGRLDKRLAIQIVQCGYSGISRPRDANIAVDARTDFQRQLVRTKSSLAVGIPDYDRIKLQICSSHCTTIGFISISGATRNSIRTSRYPGRLPTAT